jgi:hypothetical protein
MQPNNQAERKHKIPAQLFPLAILFIAAAAALIVARQFLVPPTFGKYGHYRAQAIDDNAAFPITYTGYTKCAECHDDIAGLKSQSNHRGVACEVCHGPGTKHVDDPSGFPLEAPRERGFCPLCHGFDPARPMGFPQILPILHNPGRPCISCHNPHNPLLPHAPEECSACHREIANEKAVSPHATVQCTTCHNVPGDHLTNPKFVQALKPTDRALCGQCHAKDAGGSNEILRVDMVTHGERYLCWDCHYPHYPEAN